MNGDKIPFEEKIHNQVEELLPHYIIEMISTEERTKIEKHLKTCERCRKDLEELCFMAHAVNDFGGVLFFNHIPSEKLVVFAEASRELKVKEREEIERHFKTCKDCRNELGMLKELNKLETVHQGDQKQDFFSGSRSRRSFAVRNYFSTGFMKQAFAVAACLLILILAYPLWQNFQKKGKSGFTHSQKQLINNQVAKDKADVLYFDLWAYSYRTGKEILNEYFLDPEVDRWFLTFDVPIRTDGQVRYDIMILNDVEKTVWKKIDARSVDRKERFYLQVDTSLAPGNYTLLINEVNRLDVSRTRKAIEYPFKLINSGTD